MNVEVTTLLAALWVCVWTEDAGKIVADRYAVYWNSSNASQHMTIPQHLSRADVCRPVMKNSSHAYDSPGTDLPDAMYCPGNDRKCPKRFHEGDYTVEVCINDYLDIYCPHYGERVLEARTESYILYMVNFDGYRSCDHKNRGFKRWECNRPRSPNGPLKFSEKFQLFTPFSLGFEFRPGNEYYYISSPHPNIIGKPCLKLKVYVRPTNSCMEAVGVNEGDFDVSNSSVEASDDSIYESPEPYHDNDGMTTLRMSWLILAITFLLTLLTS